MFACRKSNPNSPSRHKDFNANRDKMLRWLVWLKENNRDYQDIILRSIVMHLGAKEADYRITYVMFSRVCKFSDIGIKDGIDKHRLCEAIHKQGKMRRCIAEEKQLKMLAEATLSKIFS